MANPSTPETEAKRIKAFELYCSAGLEGKRRSIRSISQELGVALSTAQYWHKNDDWDAKLSKVLKESASTAAAITDAIRAKLRKGILDGLEEANKIIKNSSKDRDRILALRELTHIAIRLQALDLGTASADIAFTSDFKDDIASDAPVESPNSAEPSEARSSDLPA